MIASEAAITASTAAWVTSWPIAGPTEVNCRSTTSAPNFALMASVSRSFSVSSIGLSRTCTILPSPRVVTAVSPEPASARTWRSSAG